MCFVVAGPQMGVQIAPVPFQTPRHVAVPVSMGQSQGLGQTGGGVSMGPLRPLTTTTKIALGCQPRPWGTGKVLQLSPCIIGLD